MSQQQTTLSWYPVPNTVKQLLISASDAWENTAESEPYIHQALEADQTNLDVLVAAYRYFFYKNNNPMALKITQQVMDQIKAEETFPEDWDELKGILRDRRDEPNIRLYLNAYAASGLVLARLGETESAKEITARVRELDERKESCAGVVFDILTNPDPDEDD
jgi:tetratricopeptide (TPR) repeat protein